MPDPTYLVLVLVLPFAGCLVAALLPANSRNIEAWIAGIVALAGLVLTLALYPAVTDGGVIRSEAEWVPAFGLDFTLRMDGFAWMFTVLVTAIGLLVVLYSRHYMSPAEPVTRFFAFRSGERRGRQEGW